MTDSLDLHHLEQAAREIGNGNSWDALHFIGVLADEHGDAELLAVVQEAQLKVTPPWK